MERFYLKQLSSLEKVFLTQKPNASAYNKASILKGEVFSYQIAYSFDGEKENFTISIESPISDLISIHKVGNVPSETPLFQGQHDSHYITTQPGLFPDVLNALADDELEADQVYRSIWISLKTDKKTEPGIFPITVSFQNEKTKILKSVTFELEVINAVLPEQKLIFTQWFHADCIASYYQVEIFSERHWELMEQFVRTAADNGVNMILTPIFTPPLDTKVGKERPTVQLVDINKDGNCYTFGFDKLKRWIQMCKKCGITYFEMAHLFTQWGAAFTPKITAIEKGTIKRIFGWDVPAASDAYKNFLHQFLPALIEFLKSENIADKTYFHISDEPGKEHLESYQAAKSMVADLLKEFVVFDALSDYEIYEQGVVANPVPATSHIAPFFEHKVPNLWAYYCCGQTIDVGNRFMAMPAYRNRILGIQMYKYQIAGFLHWGYNFYYSQLSRYIINPFMTTDCGGSYPSGDAFSVYPGITGPLESTRIKVFQEGLQDMRALALLEAYLPREEIIAMMETDIEITFSKYPHTPEYILSLRETVNAKIKQLISE